MNTPVAEMSARQLTKFRRWFILILVSVGSSTIYTPAYLKDTFYNAQRDALQISNTQIGGLLSAFAITATICYLPSGIIADRMRMRTLSSAGFILTAALTAWYALLPSYGALLAIFVGMGITTILVWWGVRYKLVRLISDEQDYSRNIGISYGFYGAAGLLIGLIGVAILNIFGDDSRGAFRAFLLVVAAIILLLGILSLLFIPKFEGELGASGSISQILKDTVRSLTNPVVVITAVTVFFVYFYYTGSSYTTPFMKFLGANDSLNYVVSNIRRYGITILSGPIFGILAFRAKRPSRAIWIGSVFGAAGLAVLALLPQRDSVIIPVAIIGVALGFIANGVFGIVSSQLTEGRVPLSMFGAATGVVSVVGFLPDTFSSTWFGSIMDNATAAGNEGDAYPRIFWILAASAVLAVLSAVALHLYVKHNAARLGTDVGSVDERVVDVHA